MDQNRLQGAARNVGGALEEEFGGTTGDTQTQLEGKATELKRRVENLYGQAKDTAADTLKAARRAHNVVSLSGTLAHMAGRCP